MRLEQSIFLNVLMMIVSVLSDVFRFDVPYEYLATRTRLTLAEDMNIPFSKKSQEGFNNYCRNRTCFSAIFTRNGTQQYQMLLDQQNDWQILPNILGFTKAEYNYSIVFSNIKIGNVPSLCGVKPELVEKLNSVFIMPICREPFNFNFTRANGRTWCYMIDLKNSLTFDGAIEKCHELKAELNGFQSIPERDSFIQNVMNGDNPYYTYYITVGARRDVDCDYNGTCAYENAMKWLGNVSTNQALANDIITNWDGNGKCLSFRVNLCYASMKYDDMPCNETNRYSCGKYADFYPEYNDFLNFPMTNQFVETSFQIPDDCMGTTVSNP